MQQAPTTALEKMGDIQIRGFWLKIWLFRKRMFWIAIYVTVMIDNGTEEQKQFHLLNTRGHHFGHQVPVPWTY